MPSDAGWRIGKVALRPIDGALGTPHIYDFIFAVLLNWFAALFSFRRPAASLAFAQLPMICLLGDARDLPSNWIELRRLHSLQPKLASCPLKSRGIKRCFALQQKAALLFS